MLDTELVDLDLGDGVIVKVQATKLSGSELVGDEGKLVNRLQAITGPLGSVSSSVLEAVRRAAPTKAVIELEVGIAVESGKLFAVFGKGSGEAGLKVTLEWEGAGA